MSKNIDKFGYDPQENLISILPAVLAGMFGLSVTVIAAILLGPPMNGLHRNGLIAFGIVGNIYLGFYYRNYILSPNKSKYAWINVIIAGITLGVLPYLIPEELKYLVYALVLMAALATSVISDCGPAFFLIFIIFTAHSMHYIHRNSASCKELAHPRRTFHRYTHRDRDHTTI